ncbi:MAG: protein kinase domain-containing protein [Planctomycetaceae bacterium]
MPVQCVFCGEFANESEQQAVKKLSSVIENRGADGKWVLLTNLTFSLSNHAQSDEIDIVLIGPQGVRVVEVKHWSAAWVEENFGLAEQEAEKLTRKARRIGTTLRNRFPRLPVVEGAFLLTRTPSKIRKLTDRSPVRGVRLFTLNQCDTIAALDQPGVLTDHQIDAIAQLLAPTEMVRSKGSFRRLAGYVNLRQVHASPCGFHRVYRGNHPTRRDHVILHLYDLTAEDDGRALERARREADALQKLQLYSWAPRILDSFQEVPGYAGEMHFFTIVDPAAPSVAERAADADWSATARLEYARKALQSLQQLHEMSTEQQALVHRNLSPETLLVRHDNSPLITGFDRARIAGDLSISSALPAAETHVCTVAPEVQSNGLAAADSRSDTYSMCSSLRQMFMDSQDSIAQNASRILAQGMADSPADRPTIADLLKSLEKISGKRVKKDKAVPARFWSEDQVIEFNKRSYRIVSRLGSGAVGLTFKVVELDENTGEELGTFVAKVAHSAENSEPTLKSWKLARPFLGRHENLSTLYEIAESKESDHISSLLGWIEGTPLSEFTGVIPLLAEDFGDATTEQLVSRWLEQLAGALDVLHRNGLIHGDVSPKNIILSGSSPVLTDYDFVTRIGETATSPGTVLYCSPSRELGQPVSPADDLYALAAALFHVCFDREPFRYGAQVSREKGLNWQGLSKSELLRVAAVLDQATHPDSGQRFQSAAQLIRALRDANVSQELQGAETLPHLLESGSAVAVAERSLAGSEGLLNGIREPATLSPQHVEWLDSVLQAYPGSRAGNAETRGLDSDFAIDTYVPTELEATLLAEIRSGSISLVILCGNAGDGKTALLQHLASELGLGNPKSAHRIVEGIIHGDDGELRLKMNLDGSAAWQDKSADQILDEFLAPFMAGTSPAGIVHLLAVNDGRLLEWIDNAESRHGRQPLTALLYSLLQQDQGKEESAHVRFINLNHRSLVGGVSSAGSEIEHRFLESLIDQLYGGTQAAEIWAPCRQCSTRSHCHVYGAQQLFAPDAVHSDRLQEKRRWARSRLFQAFTAVHLRGEKHITIRELRGALVYILFGLDSCQDYHKGTANDSSVVPYWDRAFSAKTPARQGELLEDLARFDPALESHPQIDRRLMAKDQQSEVPAPPAYPLLQLGSARRRAFFEWTEQDIRLGLGKQAFSEDALNLTRGRHLNEFRRLSVAGDDELRQSLTRRLCEGISRLEDLPLRAFDRPDVVPLRISQRTPTETFFWAEKSLSRFRVEPVLRPRQRGISQLHRQVRLVYQPHMGPEESLYLGAELFHLLLQLEAGYQLGDVSSDDTFTNISIFTKRLLREDDGRLLAWSPTDEETVYVVAIEKTGSDGEYRQVLTLSRLTEE